MDHGEPGRVDLTPEQRAQRCTWAREAWECNSGEELWCSLEDCIASLLKQRLVDVNDVLAMLKTPEAHPATLDFVFEAWIGHKLTGGTK